MKSKEKKIIVASLIIGLVAVIGYAYMTPNPAATYTGQFSGRINMKVEAVDENGKVVTISSGSTLAFFTGETRIKELRLTVTWETYDVQAGMDSATFSFQGDVAIKNDCSSAGEQWTVNSMITPSLSSSVLNSSKQWTFNLRSQPLDLQTEADKHPNDRTDFAITFTLAWQASMYDTVDQFTETASGTLIRSASVWYVKGFKIKVT